MPKSQYVRNLTLASTVAAGAALSGCAQYTVDTANEFVTAEQQLATLHSSTVQSRVAAENELKEIQLTDVTDDSCQFSGKTLYLKAPQVNSFLSKGGTIHAYAEKNISVCTGYLAAISSPEASRVTGNASGSANIHLSKHDFYAALSKNDGRLFPKTEQPSAPPANSGPGHPKSATKMAESAAAAPPPPRCYVKDITPCLDALGQITPAQLKAAYPDAKAEVLAAEIDHLSTALAITQYPASGTAESHIALTSLNLLAQMANSLEAIASAKQNDSDSVTATTAKAELTKLVDNYDGVRTAYNSGVKDISNYLPLGLPHVGGASKDILERNAGAIGDLLDDLKALNDAAQQKDQIDDIVKSWLTTKYGSAGKDAVKNFEDHARAAAQAISDMLKMDTLATVHEQWEATKGVRIFYQDAIESETKAGANANQLKIFNYLQKLKTYTYPDTSNCTIQIGKIQSLLGGAKPSVKLTDPAAPTEAKQKDDPNQTACENAIKEANKFNTLAFEFGQKNRTILLTATTGSSPSADKTQAAVDSGALVDALNHLVEVVAAPSDKDLYKEFRMAVKNLAKVGGDVAAVASDFTKPPF